MTGVEKACGRIALLTIAAACCSAWTPVAAAEPPPDFDREIAPLLASHCLECHSGPDAESGLDLRARDRAFAGGEGGKSIVPGDADSSPLWQRVTADEMPPEHPLSDAQKALLRLWIESGAEWGTDPIDPFRWTTETRAGADWWSLQPLIHSPPPAAAHSDFARNPIDRFISAKLAEEGLDPSPEADRRTLIRRLSLDLTGLPPAIESVSSFIADSDPLAYDRLVDRLLASPHYGERWARHWLDVVRYGETDGFERNSRRMNSWHYRDWVVGALNDDLAYDEFCRRQLAGDTLPDAQSDDVIATGYLVAGVHNTVLGNDQMRALARQDELEDMIGNVSQTFLGLTANCGRCHDHKFDPISQVDYYRLSAALAGVQHGERDIVIPELQSRVEEFSAKLDDLRALRRALLATAWSSLLAEKSDGAPVSTSIGPLSPIAAWDFTSSLDDQIGDVDFDIVGDVEMTGDGAHVHNGSYLKSKPLGQKLTTKTLEAWVKLDTLDQQGGGVLSVQTPDGSRFDAIVYAEREPLHWMAGSDGFLRTQPFGGGDETDAAERFVHVAIVYAADRTITAYRNGEPYGTAYRPPGSAKFDPDAVLLVGCRHEPNVGNHPLAGVIRKARLYDTALTAEQVRASAFSDGTIASEEELLARLSDTDRARAVELAAEVAPLEQHLKRLKSQAQFPAYAVNPKQPPETHLLRRGDLALAGDVMTPGAIAALAPAAATFANDPNLPEAQRRQQLAHWMTTTARPLFARTIVNRLWHYHFGVGLVETPSDLGFNGGQPSHPELLDWLAAELIHRDFRLKDIHRLIVTSATYRQSSAPRAEALPIDADTRLHWRKRPRRLEGELVRDSLLAAAGLLNERIGGEPFSDYDIIDEKNGTIYYEPADPAGPSFHRRSVYRFLPRGANQGLLDAFDCPDPAASAPRRNTTTTPLQALALWNGAFALRMAERIAANAASAHPDSQTDQIEHVYHSVLQRAPTADELATVSPLVTQHGPRSLARALINSNEFLVMP